MTTENRSEDLIQANASAPALSEKVNVRSAWLPPRKRLALFALAAIGSFNLWAICVYPDRGSAFQNVDPVVLVLAAYAATHIEWAIIRACVWSFKESDRLRAETKELYLRLPKGS